MDGQSGTITSFDEALGRYEVVLDRYITIDDVIIEIETVLCVEYVA